MDFYAIFPPREDCLARVVPRSHRDPRIEHQKTGSKAFEA